MLESHHSNLSTLVYRKVHRKSTCIWIDMQAQTKIIGCKPSLPESCVACSEKRVVHQLAAFPLPQDRPVIQLLASRQQLRPLLLRALACTAAQAACARGWSAWRAGHVQGPSCTGHRGSSLLCLVIQGPLKPEHHDGKLWASSQSDTHPLEPRCLHLQHCGLVARCNSLSNHQEPCCKEVPLIIMRAPNHLQLFEKKKISGVHP